MKRVLAIALIGILAVSCSKKNNNNLQDSNVMLEEPKVEIKDTVSAKPADAAATTTAVTPAAAKADSTAAKK